MEATLTLHQAGELLGVEHTSLNRLIRTGALPEARKVNRPEGSVWVIDEAQLPAIASRNGWTIDLRTESSDTSETSDTFEASDTDEGDLAAVQGGDEDAGALVPHRPAVVETTESAAVDSPEATPDGDSVIELALLERLLASHEDRVAAQVQEQEARHALSALNDTHNRTTGELDIERRERMAAAERYREERRARAVADAKVAQLQDRVSREMALVEAEKQERALAADRSIKAERDAANAVALLGWRARRRYRKLKQSQD